MSNVSHSSPSLRAVVADQKRTSMVAMSYPTLSSNSPSLLCLYPVKKGKPRPLKIYVSLLFKVSSHAVVHKPRTVLHFLGGPQNGPYGRYVARRGLRIKEASLA
ncbi:hypothetical protein FRC14_006821 [Serendipita sp. 396]|nr:hypothetical protein FRC14_006821 [Serendipita sp. 396]KAG8789214.1 hypothetical protein FRC15_010707 [Serendipita sp. 397]KAG8804356.1 hypothetical protein FRC16_009570 [Serendipita sp. 398]KAG8807364.1 hypothetical protein FRC19_006686 [Serendipita sp. 401]KAG8836669.1 hypothetical protein FRC18_010934 [Serendipita sp. 400]KAG8877783.1 hypothetical protein FRC20_010034 [Serendipita sp. 405]